MGRRSQGSGAWGRADSAHVGTFTAAGYFFARELRKSVDVPIGLINVAVGGSPIERWVGPDASFYQKLVHPLLAYPIKGILWYQGEANAGESKYHELFTRLITDWRQAWGLGKLPFLFVQLPNFGQADTMPAPISSWAITRESQSTALRLPNTAQIVTIDVGEAKNIHPSNKQDVGARLALAARKVAYGESVEYSGPEYRRHTIRNGRIILEFDHVGRGLEIGRQGSELQGFTIAGADRQFVWANAKIDGGRVVVWSDRVPKPVAARYAWADNPDRANLYNRGGLPAAPFRTDEWPHKLR